MYKIAIALGSAIVFASLGDILLSRGMQSMGEVKLKRLRDLPPLIRHVFTHPMVLLGILCMACYFGAYMAALAWVDVSVANPLTALSYLFATVYAVFALRERVCWKRASGIACIVLGAIFVGISS